jgi:hypothetical protein
MTCTTQNAKNYTKILVINAAKSLTNISKGVSNKQYLTLINVPVGPIIKARSKLIKEALSGLIQEIWASSKTGHSKCGPKEDEGIINLIQAIDGADLT